MSGNTVDHRLLQEHLDDYFRGTPHEGVQGSTLRRFEGLEQIDVADYLRYYTPRNYAYDSVRLQPYLAWAGPDRDDAVGAGSIPALLDLLLQAGGLHDDAVHVLVRGELKLYRVHLEGQDAHGRPFKFPSSKAPRPPRRRANG